MYSVIGDIILDPFLGTGTTTIASILSCRNSIGYEIENNFLEIIDTRIKEIMKESEGLIDERLKSHKKFIEKRKSDGKEIKHKSSKYGFPVITRHEINISFPVAKEMIKTGENEMKIIYK